MEWFDEDKYLIPTCYPIECEDEEEDVDYSNYDVIDEV